MRASRALAGVVLAAIVAAVGAQSAAGEVDRAARVAPVNVAAPTITGTPRVGQTLAASQGQWDGAPTAFFYQWLRCTNGADNCASVAGATQPTYALTAADLGARIRVEVVASNADGSSPAKRSTATRVVRAAVADAADAAHDFGKRDRGLDADRGSGILDRDADIVHLQLEALFREHLHDGSGRGRADLRTHRRRRRHAGCGSAWSRTTRAGTRAPPRASRPRR